MGYLYLHGRKGRMVTVADQNVFPEEIEALMEALPGITRAAVLPAPMPRGAMCCTPWRRAIRRRRRRFWRPCARPWGR